MKEQFLNSKSKKELVAMCEDLQGKSDKLHKTNRSTLTAMLIKYSYRELKTAFTNSK